MRRTFTVLGQAFTAAMILAVGMTTAQAAVEDYTYYDITGLVTFADDPNLWGLTTGQEIQASVSIFGDATADGTYSVAFMYIDLGGGTSLNQADFASSGISLTLTGGALTDFAFFNDAYTFESNFTQFSDGIEGTATGDWTSIQQTAVPIPAAVWLFGSGLGLLGWIRRKPTV